MIFKLALVSNCQGVDVKDDSVYKVGRMTDRRPPTRISTLVLRRPRL